jgi:serine/threonine protein kinase
MVLMIGTTLGSYRIVRELGMGGMGVVYYAEHPMLGKRVAIKLLRTELSRNQEVVGRFFNEAKAVTTINHPGLVDIYDFGYTNDGSAYIVMEFLEGESLAARLRRERPTVDVVIALARQLAGALGAAHARGIVHRDLKPDNIYLTPDPDVALGIRAKVLDFGIAKLAPGLGGSSRARAHPRPAPA